MMRNDPYHIMETNDLIWHFFRVNVQTRRLGGSYGGKISRSTLVAAAGAVAATETGHPVRIQLDLDSNMALGKLRGQIYVKFVIVLNQVSTKNVVHLYLFLFFYL